MINPLEVEFRYNNRQFAQVDSDKAKLDQYGRDFGQIGNNLKFGETAKKEFGKLVNAGQESLNRLRNLTGDVEKSLAAPTLTFADKYKSAFSDIENRTHKLTNSFQKLAQTKADKGQFDLISQGATGAEQKVIKLTRQIRDLKKDAADPANAKFGKNLAEDLRHAEVELGKYERKLTSLSRQQRSFGDGGRNFGSGFSSSFGRRTFGSNVFNAFNSEDAGSNAFGGALLGGAAGALVVSGFAVAKNAAFALTSEIKDLTIESIKLAGNFEESTNSLAIFAGGTFNARRELNELDKVALNTPGLKLEGAEAGYKRLRALNFETRVSLDLIRGLGIARQQTGADAASVDRVITNLTQLTSGSGTAADVRQTIQAIPSLRGTFQRAFGTSDFGDINKLAKANPDEFIKKFSAELSKAQTAQIGLNITVEQGTNSLTLASRKFGEPVLQPLTRDVLGLTKTLNENENTIKKWGQNFADVYNGISTLIGENKNAQGRLVRGGRALLALSTYGASEAFGTFIGNSYEYLRSLGEDRRNAEGGQQGAEGGLGFNFQQQEEEDEKSKKAIKRRQELIDLQKQVDTAQIENNLNYSKAVAASRLKGISLIQENTKLEVEALQKQIEINKVAAISASANLSEEDFTNGKGLQIIKQRDLENARLQNQIAVTQVNAQKQIADDLKASKAVIDDLRIKLNQDNPYVSFTIEAQSAIRKLKETVTDPALLQDALKLQQALNFKQFNVLSYQSDVRALTSEQNAFRTSRIRDNELGGFQRSLETVEKKLDFAVRTFELDRKIDEADFYGRKFNPNNPKTFDQSRFSFGERYRFGEAAGSRKQGESLQEFEKRRQEAIESGIKIFDAFKEIKSLKNLSLDGTGIFGEGALADKILGLIPSRDDLLLRLKSPYASERDRAQALLSEQSNALRTQKELENRKLQDFIYDQQTKGLNQRFADEQLNLLNKQQFLSPLERAKAKVDILNPLGNDISPRQKRDLYESQQAVAKYERRQRDDAATLVKTIQDLLAGAGLPVNIKGGTVGFDESSKTALENSANGSLEIILNDLTANGANVKQTGKSLTAQDTKDYYGQ